MQPAQRRALAEPDASGHIVLDAEERHLARGAADDRVRKRLDLERRAQDGVDHRIPPLMNTPIAKTTP